MIASTAIMETMDERTMRILDAVVQEFIETGEPVSSGLLYEKYDFGIKSAMIRLELDTLQEEGYLEQPHHAAGRVPTNLGYEFYVKRVLGKRFPMPHRMARHTPGTITRRRSLPDLLAKLSEELGLLSVAADVARDAVYKSGLQALIERMDFGDREALRSVIRDFEEVDARLSKAAEWMGEGPHVFIGKKSPLTRSDELSVVGGNYRIGDATISIFAIGPKRMDYKKVIQTLKGLEDK